MTETRTLPGSASRGKGLHIGLWVAQVLRAVGFGMAGLMKLATPYTDFAAQQAWAQLEATRRAQALLLSGVRFVSPLFSTGRS